MVFPLLLDKKGAGVNDDAGAGAGYGPEQTLTLQPDETEALDTFILSASPGGNFATNAVLAIGDFSGGTSKRRALLLPDLSSIPAGSLIISATLSLYATVDNSSNARTFRVYRLKRAWVEAQASWVDYSTGNSWATAGGFGVADCEQTDIGSRAFTATETLNEFKDFSLDTDAIKEIVDGAWTNHGFLLKADTENSDEYQFASSTNATPANRPKLEVVYQAPL